jgi:hypothetical protein
MPNEPNPLSDRIHIEQLEISAHIGVPEKERSTPQRLTVSISFWRYHEQHYAGSLYHSADAALPSGRHLRGSAITTLHSLIVCHYFDLRHSDFVIVLLHARPPVRP